MTAFMAGGVGYFQSVRWDGTANGTGSTLPAGDFVARIKFTNGAGQQVSDCLCIYLLGYDAVNHCAHFGSNAPNKLYFEDQFDPNNGWGIIYTTSEQLCP